MDVNGCDLIQSFEVSNNELAVIVDGDSGEGCSGSNMGILAAEIIGGNGDYTYLWSTGENTPIIGGLEPGTYTVTVTDGNGLLGFGSGIVEAIDPITIEMITDDELGSVEAVVSGGTEPYEYQWNTPVPEFGSKIIGQPSGTYAVVVTDDKGCTAIEEAVLNPPGPCDRVKTGDLSE